MSARPSTRWASLSRFASRGSYEVGTVALLGPMSQAVADTTFFFRPSVPRYFLAILITAVYLPIALALSSRFSVYLSNFLYVCTDRPAISPWPAN